MKIFLASLIEQKSFCVWVWAQKRLFGRAVMGQTFSLDQKIEQAGYVSAFV
jgi:hypothetical protein